LLAPLSALKWGVAGVLGLGDEDFTYDVHSKDERIGKGYFL